MPTPHAVPCAESPGLAAYDGKAYATRLYGSSSSNIVLLDFKPISHQTLTAFFFCPKDIFVCQFLPAEHITQSNNTIDDMFRVSRLAPLLVDNSAS